MDAEFLKDFTKRMNSVARYSILCSNSFEKKLWKQYGIETRDEQMNMIFTVLLYIMEYSLKEEDCTIDDIAGFLEDINLEYYQQTLTVDESREMARFIVEEVLGNSGTSMYFRAFDYEKKEYCSINIRYLDNKVVYQEGGVKRTSYYLTDEGYNMVLATLEMENNMKLTIHEMLFKLHLEKADYNKAVDDIKNIFRRLKIQSQKIEEAMHVIRRNALSYSVEEYARLVEENISTVVDTREKFNLHKQVVEEKIWEFEEREMDAASFSQKEKENLDYLKVIGRYLTGTLAEHQKILGQHFDLKKLYDYELENYSNMTLVQRFPFRAEVYDLILKDASRLINADKIWNPLFHGKMCKFFNPEKMLEYQKKLKKTMAEDETVELDFDEEAYRLEVEQQRKERRQKYYESLNFFLNKLLQWTKMDLRRLSTELTEEEKTILIPTAEIFREIMIEFLSEGMIDMNVLRKEQSDYLMDTMERFVLNEMLLSIMEKGQFSTIHKIYTYPMEGEKKVCFQNVVDEAGNVRNMKCSNVGFRLE